MGRYNAIFLGATLGALALMPREANGQNQTQVKVFSPKHVTADNPRGIVTGGYNSNTINYEDALNNLKSTTGSWYGDQVVNPFIRPGYRDKDMGEREYYGSKDVNGNHVINEFADVQAIQNGNTSYRGDVNGDGVTNSTDANIIKSVINGTRPYAPSDWNYLTKAEKIEYFEKLVKLDDTDLNYHEGWDCTEYSNKFWLKFSGLERAKELQSNEYTYEYISNLIKINTENGLFNLPVYRVSTTAKNGERHAINAILVGENPLDFDDWYFEEPQTDRRVFPGDFSMRNNEGDMAKIERLCYNEYPDVGANFGTMPVISFELHPNSAPTLAWKNKDLVLSRPTNPISGIEDVANQIVENKLNVFPNPVINGYDLNIVNLGGQFNENGKIQIYDLAGRLVYEEKTEFNKENKIKVPSDKINSLNDGTYFIHFNSSRIKMMAKFVKMQN